MQLAADILATIIAPSQEALIRLAGIAVIRTFLNYFLGKVLEEQREQRKTWNGDAPVFGGSLALATHLSATSMAAKTFTG